MPDPIEVKRTIDGTQSKMTKSVEVTKKEFQNIRTGRASIALVEGIQVDYYNTPTPLKGLASISTPDPKTIAIQPWDPSVLNDIERAILKSDLGLTPMNDGRVIRMQIPPLTEERRRDLVKKAKSVGEETKVGIRNARRSANDETKKLEKDGMAEDDAKHLLDEIQKLTDKYIRKVDELVEAKETDVMTV